MTVSKKHILVLTVFTASIMGANAQTQIQFGLKGGVNFASLTNTTGGKTLVGYNAGALIKVPLASTLSLQPEVVYSRQGIKADNGSWNVNYINIPVLFTYTHPAGLFFQTGPQFGIVMSSKVQPDAMPGYDLKSSTKSPDFSWAFGAGFLLDPYVGFNVRYNMGLTGIIDGSTSKNSVFQVGIFCLFGDHKK